MTPTTKPRYPASIFRLLRRYSVRHCDHCGKQLTPHLKDGNKLETRQSFEQRKTCSKTCWATLMTNKRRAKREEQAEISPPAEPVQDAVTNPSGLEEELIPRTSPLTLLAGAGTPIPPSFTLRDQLAKYHVTTIEQVNAMTDDELLELPRVSKAKLKTLRWQIATHRAEAVQNANNKADVKPDVQTVETLQPEPPTLTDSAYGGPPAPEDVAEELEQMPEQAPEHAEQAMKPGELEVRDPRINRPVRPVKLPVAEPFKRPPTPPPSLQAKLPDPRPQAMPYTVSEGRVIERADFGTCPNEGCGQRLNAFKVCRSCKQRQDWLAGQRAKIGAT